MYIYSRNSETLQPRGARPAHNAFICIFARKLMGILYWKFHRFFHGLPYKISEIRDESYDIIFM